MFPQKFKMLLPKFHDWGQGSLKVPLSILFILGLNTISSQMHLGVKTKGAQKSALFYILLNYVKHKFSITCFYN